eukprot:3617540-Pyramimonas_sp.AAC.2
MPRLMDCGPSKRDPKHRGEDERLLYKDAARAHARCIHQEWPPGCCAHRTLAVAGTAGPVQTNQEIFMRSGRRLALV